MKEIGCNSARTIKRELLNANIEIRYGSEAIKSQWINADARKRKMSDHARTVFKPFRAQPKSEETKKKIGDANRGEKNGMFNMRGALNPMWLGGKSNWAKNRQLPTKRKKEIIKTLGGKCERCSTQHNLTIHHDPPWRVCRSHDLKFLHVLCKSCHFRGHTRQR